MDTIETKRYVSYVKSKNTDAICIKHGEQLEECTSFFPYILRSCKTLTLIQIESKVIIFVVLLEKQHGNLNVKQENAT